MDNSEPAEPNWRDRVDALLQAARDVHLVSRPAKPLKDISAPHRELFDRYVQDMRRAIRGADAWWDAMVRTQQSRGADSVQAQRAVRKLNPVGRVADRAVIATLRKYWLACEEINANLPTGMQLPPEEFVLGRLVNSPFEDVARFLSDLPYWPMGMDAAGKWI